MNRLVLLLSLTYLMVLSACRAPHGTAQEAPPATVGTAPAPAAAAARAPVSSAAVASEGRSGQPLRDGLMMPIADVLNKYQSDLSGVAFYFDGQPHPKVEKNLGEYVSNRKTNAFNKSDAEACQWVAFDALKTFKKRALDEGGNAVINIHSYYKKNDVSDPVSYECHAGFAAAGVAFKGTVAKLAK